MKTNPDDLIHSYAGGIDHHGNDGLTKEEHMATQILSGFCANSQLMDPRIMATLESKKISLESLAVASAKKLIFELNKGK